MEERKTRKGDPECRLCKRRFASAAKLRRHEEESDLHMSNLERRRREEEGKDAVAAGARRQQQQQQAVTMIDLRSSPEGDEGDDGGGCSRAAAMIPTPPADAASVPVFSSAPASARVVPPISSSVSPTAAAAKRKAALAAGAASEQTASTATGCAPSRSGSTATTATSAFSVTTAAAAASRGAINPNAKREGLESRGGPGAYSKPSEMAQEQRKVHGREQGRDRSRRKRERDRPAAAQEAAGDDDGNGSGGIGNWGRKRPRSTNNSASSLLFSPSSSLSSSAPSTGEALLHLSSAAGPAVVRCEGIGVRPSSARDETAAIDGDGTVSSLATAMAATASSSAPPSGGTWTVTKIPRKAKAGRKAAPSMPTVTEPKQISRAVGNKTDGAASAMAKKQPNRRGKKSNGKGLKSTSNSMKKRRKKIEVKSFKYWSPSDHEDEAEEEEEEEGDDDDDDDEEQVVEDSQKVEASREVRKSLTKNRCAVEDSLATPVYGTGSSDGYVPERNSNNRNDGLAPVAHLPALPVISALPANTMTAATSVEKAGSRGQAEDRASGRSENPTFANPAGTSISSEPDVAHADRPETPLILPESDDDDFIIAQPEPLWDCARCGECSFDGGAVDACNHEAICLSFTGKSGAKKREAATHWRGLLDGRVRLSPYHALLVQNAEVFTVTKDEAAEKLKPRCKPMSKEGSVGLRCIHCKRLPRSRQASLAVIYPGSIKTISTGISNLAQHFNSCKEVPTTIRVQLQSEKAGSPRASKASGFVSLLTYCQAAASILGLEDAEKGIQFCSIIPRRNGPVSLYLTPTHSSDENEDGTVGMKRAGSDGKREGMNTESPSSSEIVEIISPISGSADTVTATVNDRSEDMDAIKSVMAQADARKNRIVSAEDKMKMTDFNYVVLKQYEVCFLTVDEQQKTSFRKRLALGHPGLKCMHCQKSFYYRDVQTFRGHFSNRVSGHLMTCSPSNVQVALGHFAELREHQRKARRQERFTSFYDTIFNRLMNVNKAQSSELLTNARKIPLYDESDSDSTDCDSEDGYGSDSRLHTVSNVDEETFAESNIYSSSNNMSSHRNCSTGRTIHVGRLIETYLGMISSVSGMRLDVVVQATFVSIVRALVGGNEEVIGFCTETVMNAALDGSCMQSSIDVPGHVEADSGDLLRALAGFAREHGGLFGFVQNKHFIAFARLVSPECVLPTAREVIACW